MLQLVFIFLIIKCILTKDSGSTNPLAPDTQNAFTQRSLSRFIRSPSQGRELTVRLNMSEELPVGHSFGSLVELLRPILPPDHVRNATARRVIASKLALMPTPYFALVGGNLTLASRVDREALLPSPACRAVSTSSSGPRKECVLQQRVVVPLADSSLRVLHATLLVDVTDVDDNMPRFPVEQIEATLSEGAPVGTVVLTFPAVADADELKQSENLEYRLAGEHAHYLALSSSSQPFTKKTALSRLRVNTTGAVVSLVLARRLDRESEQVLEAEVEVFDAQQGTSFNTSLRVRVVVGDVNEFDPVFVRMPMNNTVTLSEEMPVGTLVWHLYAFDNDTDDAGELRFGLSSAASDGVKKHFRVDARSWELRTASALDYETATLFELPVIVWDRSTQAPASDPGTHSQSPGHDRHSRTATATLVVQVTNENDNSPAIALRSSTLEVRENTHAREDFLELVTVTDADPGDNERLACAVDDPRFAITLAASNQGACALAAATS